VALPLGEAGNRVGVLNLQNNRQGRLSIRRLVGAAALTGPKRTRAATLGGTHQDWHRAGQCQGAGRKL
jgi:hypothetical protein